MAGKSRGEVALLSGIALSAALGAYVLRPRHGPHASDRVLAEVEREQPAPTLQALAAPQPESSPEPTTSGPPDAAQTSLFSVVVASLLICAIALLTLLGALLGWSVDSLATLIASNAQIALALLGAAAVLLAYQVITECTPSLD